MILRHANLTASHFRQKFYPCKTWWANSCMSDTLNLLVCNPLAEHYRNAYTAQASIILCSQTQQYTGFTNRQTEKGVGAPWALCLQNQGQDRGTLKCRRWQETDCLSPAGHCLPMAIGILTKVLSYTSSLLPLVPTHHRTLLGKLVPCSVCGGRSWKHPASILGDESEQQPSLLSAPQLREVLTHSPDTLNIYNTSFSSPTSF